MPHVILTINQNPRTKNFSWNQTRGNNIVSSSKQYNQKQSLKKVLKNTVFQGWIFDWKLGTAILLLAGGKTKNMFLVDNSPKRGKK